MMSRDEIFSRVKETLVEMFGLKESLVTPTALLADDLDFDSIDAIDLIVKLEDVLGPKIREQEFTGIRTVGDIVDVVDKLLRETE